MFRKQNLQKLLTNYERRLQKLKEQQAKQGLHTPPHILIEIEDIEAEIDTLYAKLMARAELPTQTPSSISIKSTIPFVGRLSRLSGFLKQVITPKFVPGTPLAPVTNFEFDVFVSYAYSDKHQFLTSLLESLNAYEIRVWVDELELSWGSDIIGSINHGLAKSKFVLLCFSAAYLRREWPVAEMSAILARQLNTGQHRVLPLLISDIDYVLEEIPILASIRYRILGNGTESLAKELAQLCRISVSASQEPHISVTVESVHHPTELTFRVNERSSVATLIDRVEQRLGLRRWSDVGAYENFPVRWVAVDIQAEAVWNSWPLERRKNLVALVAPNGSLQEVWSARDKISEAGFYEGISLHMHAVPDDQPMPVYAGRPTGYAELFESIESPGERYEALHRVGYLSAAGLRDRAVVERLIADDNDDCYSLEYSEYTNFKGFLAHQCIPYDQDRMNLAQAIWDADLMAVKTLIPPGTQLPRDPCHPLHHRAIELAALRGPLEVVSYLLKQQPSKEDLDDAFTAAATHDHVEIMKLLLAKGADPHRISQAGRNILMWAVTSGATGAVRYLLEIGADYRLCDDEGLDALAIAEERTNQSITQFLREWPDKSWGNMEESGAASNGANRLVYPGATLTNRCKRIGKLGF